ncbi:hypothetical protein N665_0181s0099, partial [Sinapis alba]
MERGGRRSGGVLIKKRSSSGCLILKKKSDGLGNLSSFPRSTSDDSESSGKPHQDSLMRDYGNVDEPQFGLKRDYPEDCFVGNSREWKERHRLEDEEEEEESEDEFLRRSYDGSKKSYMGSAQFGTNRECGSASSSKYLDIERRRRRPCLDKVGGNE